MSGHHRVETVAKALRRKAQLQRWSRQRNTNHEATSASSSLPSEGGAAVHPRSQVCAPQASAHAAVSFHNTNASATSPASSSQRAGNILASNQALQRAYQHRDTALTSTLQKQLVDALQTCSSKAEAAEAFFLVAGSDKEVLAPATVAHFTSTMLKHNVVAQMGVEAYEAALADAVGAAQGGRWSDVDPAEARAFILYQARRLQRYSVKGTTFEEKLGLTLEGADNAVVALTQFQLQRHAAQALPVSVEVLEHLLHLDVSWSNALKVYSYAKELATVDPPAGMTTRLMSLMTGYKTNGLGSRPWSAALQLYERLLESGYEIPLDAHAAALDAVWRRNDTFAKPHSTPSADTQAQMWTALVRIRENVKDATVTGEAGCRFSEALIKAASAAGRWEAAVQLLSDMDVSLADTSSRLLVPTAEAFLFAMAACNVARNAAYASSLLQVFSGLYTLRSAHPEAVATYLQSLRHVEHLTLHIGPQVEALVTDGNGLDRPCSIACLQLLSSQRVHTKTEKWRLAQRLLQMYDSNPWPQQPQARQAELHTVFRCCHLIAAGAGGGASNGSPSCPLVPELKSYLTSLFGAASPECRWLEDTEVYSLLTTSSWQHALAVFQRRVRERPVAKVADLPIPLRQVRRMLAQTLVRCGRAAHTQEDQFLLDEDRQEQDKAAVHDYLAFAVRTVRDVYSSTADTMPRDIIGELLLLQSLHTTQSRERQRLALEAMRELAFGDASSVTPRIVDLVSQALSLTEEHVQAVLVEGGTALRAKALQDNERHFGLRAPCLERVFL